MKKRVGHCLAASGVGILGLLGVSSLQAQPIAHEPFDYVDGSPLFGQTGGSGWATYWSATSAAIATNAAASMAYSTLPSSGGRVVIGNPAGSTATTASMQRMLPNTLGNLAASASGTVWMSCLYQNLVTDLGGFAGYREAKIALFSGATAAVSGAANVNGSEKLDIGTPNTYATGASDTLSLWQGSTFVSSGIATPRGADPANTVFLLVRLDVDNSTATDTAYAWFNPSLASEPSIGTAIAFTASDLSGVNAIRFQAGNQNSSALNAVFQADELRLGFSFDSVTVPEPTAFVLGLLGGLAILFMRQRRM